MLRYVLIALVVSASLTTLLIAEPATNPTSQPTTTFDLPRIHIERGGMNGSTETTVEPNGLFTCVHESWLDREKSTFRCALTRAERKKLAEIAAKTLSAKSDPSEVTDYYAIVEIGDFKVHIHAIDPRYDELFEALSSRCARAGEPTVEKLKR